MTHNGTLSGAGTATGNLVASAGGTLSPGTSLETIPIVANVTWRSSDDSEPPRA